MQPEFIKAWEYLPFISKVSDEDRQNLFSHSRLLGGAKGTVIHGGLNDCTGIIVVLEGTLRSYILSDEGREVTLYRLSVGDVCVLSASCILKNISFEVFISSESNFKAVLFSASQYEIIRKKYREADEYTNALIAERFSDVMWTVEKILFLSFDRRLAMFLLEQAQLEGGSIVSLTHEEIAKNVASAREVVTRMLKYFAGEGLVNISRKNIEISDIKRLKELAFRNR